MRSAVELQASVQRLSAVGIAMVDLWRAGLKHECYRRYFIQSLEDRQILLAMFEKSQESWPDRHTRRIARGIHTMIEINRGKEIALLSEATTKMLQHWLDSPKEIFYAYWLSLDAEEKEFMLLGLKEVISESEHPKLRQAAKDIPEWLKTKESAPSR